MTHTPPTEASAYVVYLRPHTCTQTTPRTHCKRKTHTLKFSLIPLPPTLSLSSNYNLPNRIVHINSRTLVLCETLFVTRRILVEGFTDTMTYAHLQTHAHSLPLSYTHNLPKQLVCANLRCTLYSTLHTATLCNTLQHSATLCNTDMPRRLVCTNSRCVLYSLQNAAARYNTLQHTSALCNILQHSATQTCPGD